MRLNAIPVHQWTHRQFVGPDPWAGGQLVTWEVVVYSLLGQAFVQSTPLAECAVPAHSNDIPTELAVGIYNRPNNRYRVLPLALQDMFRAEKIQDRDLPWLLHEVEDPLKLIDYPPAGLPLLMLFYMSMFAVVAVLTIMLQMPMFAATLLALGLICGVVFLRLRQRRQSLADRWLEILSTARSRPSSLNPPAEAFPGKAAGR